MRDCTLFGVAYIKGENDMEQIKLIFAQVLHFLEVYVLYRIERIGVRDVVDMILLALIFFFLFNFIINKRAARLVSGLVFLLVLMIASMLAELKGVSLIFTEFRQAGIVAILILFQPELRSVLEQIGNAPMTNIKHMSTDTRSAAYVSNAIQILTETACDLSMEKTGALIVIEGSTKLGEHIKTGTILNAMLSSQLLKNVFFNKAPLHDGAVILRNYRIYSAGCFLPLSLNEDIDENMGTRHRAALGISEVSDAVVIVVSEETGKISIAHNGELKQNYSYKSLHKELTELLLPNDNTQRSKKGTKEAK